jgi:hypothetical protein
VSPAWAVLIALAAGAGAPPADAPAAGAPSQVGERSATPSAEQVALREQAVLTGRRRGTVELGVAYARAERDFGVVQLQQQVASAELALRYGVAADVQLSARVPWSYRRSAAANPPARDERRAFGDVALGAFGVVLREGAGRPNLILSLEGVAPAGAGDAGLGAGAAVTKSYDPMILFAGMSYLRGLRIDPEDLDRPLARHNFAFSLGVAFAANDAVALTAQLVGTNRSHATTGASFRSREAYRLQVGLTLLLTRDLFAEPVVGVAVGAGSPDLTLALTLPYSF